MQPLSQTPDDILTQKLPLKAVKLSLNYLSLVN